jgi:3-oxoacyl-[acyl-carrier protein] reductase
MMLKGATVYCITRDGLIIRMPTADWEEVLRANLTSAFLASRDVARTMVKQRSGAIINISSVSGIMGKAGQVIPVDGGLSM